jgi:hypothetical protein
VFSDGRVFVTNVGASNVSGYAFLDGVEFDTESVLQVASVAAVPMDSWHLVGGAGEPSFQGTWKNLDNAATVPGTASQRNARFRKYPDGRVRLAGVVALGTSGSTVFTLPPGYRPVASDVSATVWCNGGMAAVDITSAGLVTIQQITGTVATWCYLDGVEFDTETVANYVAGAVPALPGVARAVGATGAWSGNFTAAGLPILVMDTGVAPNVPMALTFTPLFNCWWPVEANVLLRVLDAAWYQANVGFKLTPNDEVSPGFVPTATVITHNALTYSNSVSLKYVFALKAGVTYGVALQVMYLSGGTWNYHMGGNQSAWIESPGAVPR